MTNEIERLQSVIAALKSVRKHVNGTFEYHWSTRIFNRWIDMLGDTLRRKAQHLRLRWFRIAHNKFRLHLDASIAFLEHELAALRAGASASGFPIPETLDAEFTEVSRTRRKFWPPRLIKK